MSGRFPRTPSGREGHVFTPTRFQSVSNGVAWVPESDDIAFAVTTTVGYSLDAGTTYVTLDPGTIRGIAQTYDSTYMFNADTVIEVM